MNSDRVVTVCRTVSVNGCSITETASAELADDLVLDAATESAHRALLAHLLFQSLPSIQSRKPCPPPPPRPPHHSRN